jgi:prepilin-type N-terminal cleavage/methylation domain-containing protein
MISETGNKCGKDQGFTLIEVLVATVILFAGLAAVLGAYSSAVTALDRATDMLMATSLLQEKAADVELAAGLNRLGMTSSSGSYGSGASRYSWTVTCRPLESAAGVEISEAVIDVRRAIQAGQHSLVTQWAPVRQPGQEEMAP